MEAPGSGPGCPSFTLQKNGVGHRGESITILLAAQPINGLSVPQDAIALDSDVVAGWERSAAKEVLAVSSQDLVGNQRSSAEEQAVAEATRRLTYTEAAPQTIFTFPGRVQLPVMVEMKLIPK